MLKKILCLISCLLVFLISGCVSVKSTLNGFYQCTTTDGYHIQMSFDKENFLILTKFNWSNFPLAVNTFFCHLKNKSFLLQGHKDILLCFLLEACLTFTSPFFLSLPLIFSPNPSKFVICKDARPDNINGIHKAF